MILRAAVAVVFLSGICIRVSAEEFEFSVPRPICGNPYWVELTDRDGDGNLDLLTVANPIFAQQTNLAEIALAFGDGTGQFPRCSVYVEELPLLLNPMPDGAVFGDFNEDGATDVLAGDHSRNSPELEEEPGLSRLVLFLSSGDSFVSREVVSSIEKRTGPFPMAVGDLDLDGNLDIVFANTRLPGGPYLKVYRGDGTGNLSLAADWDLDLVPEDLELADLSGDGLLDLAILLIDRPNSDRRTIKVYIGDRLASWASTRAPVWEGSFGGTLYRTRLRAGDVIRDRSQDLVVVSGREIDGEQVVLIYPGLGDGKFQASPVRLPVGLAAVESVLGDFDEDGKSDLIVHGEVSFQVLLSSENYQTLRPNWYLYRVDGAPHTEMKVGDFDKDGHLDLAVPDSSYQAEPSIVLIRGRGDGTFEAAIPQPECGGIGSASFGDLNEDGTADLVALKQQVADLAQAAPGLCVLLGIRDARSDPFFQAGDSYYDRAYFGRPCVADLNNDQHLDVAYGYLGTCASRKPSFTVRLGRGDGTLGDPRIVETPFLQENNCASDVYCADLNMDSNSDFFLLSNEPSTFLGRGDGTFTYAWSLSDENSKVPPGWSGLTLLDANQDGLPDAMITTVDVTPEQPLASWFLLGRGDATFERVPGIKPESRPGVPEFGRVGGAAAVSDFNNDGVPDISIIFLPEGQSLYQVRVYLLPLLELAFISPPLSNVEKIYSADTNSDGNSDLLVVQRFWISEGVVQRDLSVLYGLGDGRFEAPQWITSRPFHDLHVRDMNSDGTPDFVLVGGGLFSPGLEVILQEPPSLTKFIRGDSNSDGEVNISDAVFTLSFLFLGGGTPVCQDAGDADDNGTIDITDAIRTLNYLFLGTATLPRPFPEEDFDPTPDQLSCRAF